MNARTHAGLVLGSLVAAALAVACTRDLSGPGVTADAGRARFTIAPDSGVVCSDSVYAGYGSEACGGLCYEQFEYDPETCTEYVVTPDPEDTTRTLQPTPTQPAPPPPAPTQPTPTAP